MKLKKKENFSDDSKFKISRLKCLFAIESEKQ